MATLRNTADGVRLGLEEKSDNEITHVLIYFNYYIGELQHSDKMHTMQDHNFPIHRDDQITNRDLPVRFIQVKTQIPSQGIMYNAEA